MARGALRAPPLWLLGLVTITGSSAMHILAPALALLARDFSASVASAQLTLSVYTAGLGIGQLFYGPLSDRIGRRPTLLAGMVVYALAGIATLAAPSIELLIVARFFQALGAASGLVLGRAIVRDSAPPGSTARQLSMLNLFVTCGPAIAPLLGTALMELGRWSWILVFLVGSGVVNLLLSGLLLAETAPLTERSRNVFHHYGVLLRAPVFLAYAAIGGAVTGTLYAFIGAAPFLFVHQLHRPAYEVGFYLALNIAAAWLGNATVAGLAGRVRTGRLMIAGSCLGLVGAVSFLLLASTGTLTVERTVVALLILNYGGGIAAPTAMAQAFTVVPQAAGSCSGLYGFLQMTISAVAMTLPGLGADPARSAGWTMVLLLGGGQSLFWTVRLAQRGAPSSLDSDPTQRRDEMPDERDLL